MDALANDAAYAYLPAVSTTSLPPSSNKTEMQRRQLGFYAVAVLLFAAMAAITYIEVSVPQFRYAMRRWPTLPAPHIPSDEDMSLQARPKAAFIALVR